MTFKVQAPSVPDRPEWKLAGQIISVTLPITDPVSELCICDDVMYSNIIFQQIKKLAEIETLNNRLLFEFSECIMYVLLEIRHVRGEHKHIA